MKRVAIPVVEGKLSEHFGQCNYYQIFEIDGNSIIKIETEIPPHHNIEKLPEWATTKKVTDVIAYKIDKSIISLFSNNKINLFIGVRMNTPLGIIDDYMNGNLKSDSRIINEITGF